MADEQAETVADGYCPKCGALDDEMCQTPSGKPRSDHVARHPFPPQPECPHGHRSPDNCGLCTGVDG